MPQIDIKNIELFHRDDYPANKTRLPSGNVIETMSILIEPKFTEQENKVDDFFSIKPRRFTFTVRKSDYAFFDVDESPFAAHANYPNLSNYMIRVFDSSEAIIFEGIISIENNSSYDYQTFTVTAYDILVLIYDSALSYSVADLQAYHQDPHDLADLLFGHGGTQVFGKYFLNSSYFPDYDDSWVEWDWNLAAYKTVHDWDGDIAEFYNLAEGAWKQSADDYFDSIVLGAETTDVYDYSKLEICRGGNLTSAVMFLFIGCIAYEDKVNGHSYIKVWWSGSYYNNATKSVVVLTENMELSAVITYNSTNNAYVAACGHNMCRYYSNRIYHFRLVQSSSPPYLYTPFLMRDNDIFDPIFWLNDFYTKSGLTQLYHLIPPNYKSMIVMRDIFQWRPLAPAGYTEYLYLSGDLPMYWELLMPTYEEWYNLQSARFRDAFMLRNEGGEEQYIISDRDWEKDYLYNMNDDCVIDVYEGGAYSEDVRELTSDSEEGIFDFWSYGQYQGWYSTYKFKVQYETYPLSYASLGLDDVSKFHKIGNISRILNKLPTDATYALYYTGNAYDYKLPESGEQYAKTSELLKMLLATMNLYVYYDNCTVKLISTNSTLSTVVVADEEVVGIDSATGKKQYIDCSNQVSILNNYLAILLNPFYNSIAGLDNVGITTKVSKLNVTYDIKLNSVVNILGSDWRVEKINPYIAYYDLSLVKYIDIPT